MLASIPLSDPPTTPSRANDGGRVPSGDPGTSTAVSHPTPVKKGAPYKRTDILDYEQVKITPTDAEFLKNHLRSAPPLADVFDQTTKAAIDVDVVAITKVKNIEKPIYAPLASLLTTMSEALYNTLENPIQDNLRKRHRITPGKPGHLTFVDHHATAGFPEKALGRKADGRPDLCGVYNIADFEYGSNHKPIHGHKIYKGIPHHRIEAIVQAKHSNMVDGCEIVTTHAHRHHQARPDHPGVYCLVAMPGWYQVIFSDPTGVVASPETPWDNLDLLAAYIYSHYCPPPGHFLWDDTIQWVSGATVTDTPTWKVQVQNRWYTDGELMFLAEPWGRRTTILRAKAEDGQQIIIKEMYREDRLFTENAILEQIHRECDLLGVVRMQGWEEVHSGSTIIECAVQKTKRTKVRFALLDSGVSLLQARSVNDLLKAIYDTLEVHRTMYNERKVMHRDMSFHNILMYPKLGNSTRPLPPKGPAFIENILRGSKPTEPVFPACLVIDFDHAADLDAYGSGDMLKERTGTPIFIARSVSLGMTLKSYATLSGKQMPLLEGRALELYQAVHGHGHYERYNDRLGSQNQSRTVHGGLPPTRDIDEYTAEKMPVFSHRLEYDVESIYWTMLYTLLRVHPDEPDVPRETEVSRASQAVWNILLHHYIPERGALSSCEQRVQILDYVLWQWEALFCDKMKDVALLMLRISRHIVSEYAMWEGQLQPDHLHEALQRLILQYLVDHRDSDIPFNPNHLRLTSRSIDAKGHLSPQPLANVVDVRPDRLSGRSGGPTGDGGASLQTRGTSALAVGSHNHPSLLARISPKRKSENSHIPSDPKRRKTSVSPGEISGRFLSDEGGSIVAATVGASSAASIPVRTSSKRKSDDLDKPPLEGLRRSKRRNATLHRGISGAGGNSAVESGGRGRKGQRSAKRVVSGKDTSGPAKRGSGAISTLVESSVPGSRSKTANSEKSSGVRSSQRLKDAAAKRDAAKKGAEQKGAAKRLVRGTRHGT